MEPPVVPDGEVRAGAEHHAVSLNDVEKARRASVLAYCARLCNPAAIADAADAAFADFRAALETGGRDEVVDLDRVLLEATRDAAAARVEPPSASPRIASRRSSNTCRLMPMLLAARASGRLGASDRAAVERHLTRCPRCRELDSRRDEAEEAYAALLGAPVPGAPAPVAEEPFAPGDPEPEVTAAGPFANDAPEAEPYADDEPLAATEALADHEPFAETEPLSDPAPHDEPAAEPPPPEDALAPRDAEEAGGRTHDRPDTAEYDVLSEGDGSEPRRGDRGRKAIVAVLAAGVVIFAIGLVQLLGGDDESTTQPSPPAAKPAAAPAVAPPADTGPSRAELRFRARLRSLGDRELGPGTTGADVRALQKLLGVQQTGNYGELTAYAVRQFQAGHDLPATGVADQATKRKLARRRKPPESAPVPPPAAPSTPPPANGTTPPPTGGTATPTTPTPGSGTTPPPAGDGTGTAPNSGQ